MTTFKDAISEILSNEKLSDQVNEIRVVVTHGWAEIEFKDKGRAVKSVFGKPHDKGLGALSIQVGVRRDTIYPLAKTVRGLLCTIE